MSETGEGTEKCRLPVPPPSWGAENSIRSAVDNIVIAARCQMGTGFTGDRREGVGQGEKGEGVHKDKLVVTKQLRDVKRMQSITRY